MSYFGGKGGDGVYQTLINQIPPHFVYIEACLGGGAVLRHKRPALLNIGIDRDSRALGAFERRQVPGLTQHNTRLIEGDCLKWIADAFNAGGSLLDHPWSVFRFDGWSVPAENVFIYFDPPYPLETRKSPRDRYLFEWDDDLHGRLLNLLQQLRCKVMVSSYPNERYGAALGDWRALSFQSQTRGGMATEQLWMNYADGPLHDYRYLGSDRREREKIRRRVRNWSAGIARMPIKERVAVFSEVLETMRPLLSCDTAASMSALLGGSVFPPAATLEHAAVDRVWPRCRRCNRELWIGEAGLVCSCSDSHIIRIAKTELGRIWRSLSDLRAAYPERCLR